MHISICPYCVEQTNNFKCRTNTSNKLFIQLKKYIYIVNKCVQIKERRQEKREKIKLSTTEKKKTKKEKIENIPLLLLFTITKVSNDSLFVNQSSDQNQNMNNQHTFQF